MWARAPSWRTPQALRPTCESFGDGHRIRGPARVRHAARLASPTDSELESLPRPQADALRSDLALGPSAPGDAFATFAGVLGLLVAAAERQPVLVLLDDAHLVDRSSAHALGFALRRLRDEPVSVLLALREGSRPPSTPRASRTASSRRWVMSTPAAAEPPGADDQPRRPPGCGSSSWPGGTRSRCWSCRRSSGRGRPTMPGTIRHGPVSYCHAHSGVAWRACRRRQGRLWSCRRPATTIC